MIAGLVLLFLPAIWICLNRPGLSALALLWVASGGYLLKHIYLDPMEKLWKVMRNFDSKIPTTTYKKFLKKVYLHLIAQEERITREKKGREEVESILFSMVEGVVATDSSGRISFLNPAAERLFQIEHGSALGKYPREVRRDELVEMFHQALYRTTAKSGVAV